MFQIIDGEPRLDGVPDELLATVRAALHKDPAARPTAREMLASLVNGSVTGDASALADRAIGELRAG